MLRGVYSVYLYGALTIVTIIFGTGVIIRGISVMENFFWFFTWIFEVLRGN